MHPITLLQNTPVEDIQDFCKYNNYGLVITGTGEFILVHEPKELKPVSIIEMAQMTLSGLEELSELVKEGYIFDVTKATDGTDIILAYNLKGYSRMFLLKITQEEE